MLNSQDLREQFKDVRQRCEFSPIWPLLAFLTLIFAIWLVVQSQAHAGESIKTEDAVHAIIGEAENQGDYGILALGCALYNRGTLVGVYGLHNPRVIGHKYSKRTAHMASMVWTIANNTPEYCEFIHGADTWGTLSDIAKFKHQKWFKNYILVAHIKDHYFYKQKKG